MFIYNDSRYKIRRQELRKDQTDYEQALWSLLRNKKCHGFKFFRQYSVGDYILDFYCPELKLCIELDGKQHIKQKEYDQIRTDYLSAHNITELRFWNDDISENLEGVYEKIENFCRKVTKF